MTTSAKIHILNDFQPKSGSIRKIISRGSFCIELIPTFYISVFLFDRTQLRNADNCGNLGGDGDKNLTKIVNGVVVSENEIPWQLSLLKKDGSWDGCGAILLSCHPLIVITAAHCVQT